MRQEACDGAEATGLRVLARCLVPVVCPGCGLDDVRVCEECAAPWWEAPFRSDSWALRLDIEDRAKLPVWSITHLAGTVHLTVRAWKDGGRRDLDPFFADAMSRAAGAVASALAMVEAVVPIPAHPRSLRSRGVDLTTMLAGAASSGLSNAGHPVSVERLLLNRGRESRSLTDRDRWVNATRGIGALDLPVEARTVALVDDVVTTGASLARASEVLEARGVAVVGALTLAATPPPGSRTSVPKVRLT